MTHDQIIDEIREIEADLLAYKKARDVLSFRLLELESQPERLAVMLDWPAYKVVENGLIMAIVRCEGLLEDYQKMLGLEIPNNVVKLERP